MALGAAAAHRVGAMLGRTRTSDVVDASVAELAIRVGADVLTSDPDDMERLLEGVRNVGVIGL